MTTATEAEPLYLELPPTASFARRRVGWFAGRGAAADGRLGTLRLVLYPRVRSQDAVEIDEYGVQEEADTQEAPGCRSFLLENDDDPDEEGPFRCVVGSAAACGCEMGNYDRRRETQVGCKHRAALSALVAAGAFPEPLRRRRYGGSVTVTRFTDGPARGRWLTLARAPQFLRVTRDARTGKFDALDQLADEPLSSEEVWVYVSEGEAASVHIDYRDADGRRRGRTERLHEYRLCADQPDEETLRDTQKWRAWCVAQAAKVKASNVPGAS